ncbi:EscC/YscC/HrcC family type III secretion system outer membrane ring protein [Serratia proteamaculans]|uniref:type III secretion system outer membrane ring subunit SctC n=1 Tax=Serratia proteamaculans TaxID=28151 RepID=UPI0010760DD7|nr:type III secretion system outer membrane ring subunit SctC [Serratia proteamaculans]TFZ48690.1 EscC/YscC/HrcC family type III secretion system outer membrane ring protein [Serratia proteamaculans]
MKRNILCAWLLTQTMLLAGFPAWAAEPIIKTGNGYVAKNESLSSFFVAMSAQLQKPIIISKQVTRKQISGDFDFSNPQELLEHISQQLGLIWYHDGQAIYVYDASETRNAVISLRTMSLKEFNEFLQRSGLYDKRYPLRGDTGHGTFYISGPPVFVDLVVNTANLIDKPKNGIELGRQKIGVLRLNNTFVNDRVYALREQKIIIPGVATVIEKLLQNETKPVQPMPESISSRLPVASEEIPSMPDFSSNTGGIAPKYTPTMDLANALQQQAPAGDIKVIAYPDTNSLLIKGTAEQVRFIEQLATALDIAKRHVELSLWIIDLNKEDLGQLGVSWSGSATFGASLGTTLNQVGGAISMLDGNSFIAHIKALEQKRQATVVSRPVLLTQENVPAIFDNNRTFYAKLIGERNASLEHVTYGTMVSVLPRFSADGQIEMSLNIEDGREDKAAKSGTESSGALPEVGRTHISTVARVPQNKSLLIGGYTRDVSSEDTTKIPLLGNIPIIGGLFRYSSQNKSNMVRVFLIQPREITEPLAQDAIDFTSSLAKKGGIDLDSAPLQKWVRSYLDRDVREFNHGN